MRHRYPFGLLVLILLTPGLSAQETLAPPEAARPPTPTAPTLTPANRILVELAARDNRVMEHLDYLANAIGPRLTGSEALVRACTWARDRFAAWGLERCRLETFGTVAVSFNRGPWSGIMRWTEKDKKRSLVLRFATPAWTAGTHGARSGPALPAPATEAELETLRPRLKGAWLVRMPPVARTGGGRPARVDRRAMNRLLAACEKAGIRGVISGARDDHLRLGGNRRLNWRKLTWETRPTVARITMIREHRARLADLLRRGVAVELEFNIQNRFRRGPVPLVSVLADLPGTEKPDEYVILGAHIDSWDHATGAVDNGSGVAAVMEAARLLARSGLKPRRTIRFALWGGEEQGLLGSRHYVKAHREELGRISAYLNHDGGTNYLSGLGVTEAMWPVMAKVCADLATLDPAMPFKLTKVGGLGAGGSDHASFVRAGVPGFFWRQSGGFDYRHIWHTQYDHYDQVIARYQRHSALVQAIVALGLANAEGRLSREKMTRPGGGRRRFSATRFLGVEVKEMVLTKVTGGGRAARMGLQVGDRILKIGDRKVGSMTDLVRALFATGGQGRMTLLRQGKAVEQAFDIRRRRPVRTRPATPAPKEKPKRRIL